MDILKDYLTAMNEHSQILIENLKKHDSNEEICLEPYLKACALDIICGKTILFDFINTMLLLKE
jgi:hypothetical protein